MAQQVEGKFRVSKTTTLRWKEDENIQAQEQKRLLYY